jgi:hypothetical protein
MWRSGSTSSAVAIEALDVVALVGAAVAEDVHAVLLHRAHDRGRRHGAAERRRVEVLLAARRPGGTRRTGSATIPSRTIASRQSSRRADLAPCSSAIGGMSAGVLLVGLREIGRVAVHLEPLARQPRHRAARVEAAGEGDADAGTLGRKLLVDAAHAAGVRVSGQSRLERSRLGGAEGGGAEPAGGAEGAGGQGRPREAAPRTARRRRDRGTGGSARRPRRPPGVRAARIAWSPCRAPPRRPSSAKRSCRAARPLARPRPPM